MSRLRLMQRTETPPDQFRYKFKEDGYMVKCFTHDGWLARIADHRNINGYETPPDWKAEAEAQLCALLPPGWCEQETGEPPEWFVDARINVNDALRGTNVLASFIAEAVKGIFTGQSPLVEKSLAAERGAICATCPFAMNVAGCGACAGLSNAIAEVVGSETLPSDTLLGNKVCVICKCSARAQAWLPIELLAKGVTDEMMPKWPMEWCWKGQALKALSESV